MVAATDNLLKSLVVWFCVWLDFVVMLYLFVTIVSILLVRTSRCNKLL